MVPTVPIVMVKETAMMCGSMRQESIEVGVQVERGKVFQMPFILEYFRYMHIIVTWCRGRQYVP